MITFNSHVTALVCGWYVCSVISHCILHLCHPGSFHLKKVIYLCPPGSFCLSLCLSLIFLVLNLGLLADFFKQFTWHKFSVLHKQTGLSTICHLRGTSAVSARGPGTLDHPAEISAVMRLERKPQLWVQVSVLSRARGWPCISSGHHAYPAAPLHQLPWGSESLQQLFPSLGQRGPKQGPSDTTVAGGPRSRSRRGTRPQGHLLAFSEGSVLLRESMFCYWLPHACF